MAARLEAQTKVIGEPILIEAVTRAALGDEFKATSHGLVQFKGKTTEVEVFSIPVGQKV
jgi:class 3 adenylate cyclase